MIARIWHGWTKPENADAYEEFLRTSMFPSMRHVDGFRGADLLRRDGGRSRAVPLLARVAAFALAGDALLAASV